MAVRVNQQSKTFQNRPEITGNKNMFDLSHDVKTTFTMGKLVPFLVKETLPDDEWFIRGEFMFRFAPLYLPIMHRVNMSADYFYIPYRILWPSNSYSDSGNVERDGWEFFIMGQTNNITITTHPVTEVQGYNPTIDKRYELPMYMGFPTKLGALVGAVGDWLVNAFPLSAYYMVWDQWYRNDQIQEPLWYGLTGGQNVLPNPTGTPAGTLTCKYRNWNRDYFTSATPLPQLGENVKIPLVDTDFLIGTLSPEGPFRFLNIADDLPASGAISATVVGGESGVAYAAGTGGAYLDTMETAGTIAQLRQALMLQEFLERGMRAGDRYSDNMMARWGVDPYKGVIQQPEFLGGKKGKVIVSEVMSTTETATLKVGNYAGQAMVLESTNDTISYHCKEHGVILGLISVYPDSSYMQGLDKMWTRSLYTDYAWQEFALIGDQAILNKEVNMDIRDLGVQPDIEYNDSVFGYIPRYSEYRYANDLYTGDMRITYTSFHLGRILSIANPQLTVLDSDFLECRPDVTRVFQVTEGEDEIFAHIYNDIKVQRKLPKFGIPQI